MFATIFTVPVLLGTALAPMTVQVDPYKEVVRGFDPRVDANAELFVRRYFPDTGTEWSYKFQTSTSGSGSVFLEFIHPTTMQGLQIILDDKLYQEFRPGEKTIVALPSPLKYEPTTTERMNLLKLNYTATYEGSVRVAGRRASVVKLIPDSREVYARRVWVDEGALFLLKHEIWMGDSEKEVLFQALQFKPLADGQKFSFSSNRGTGLVRAAKPQEVGDPGLATGLVGFTPPTKVNLPYGVEENVRHIIPSENTYRVVRIKATDGIASLTVYLWKASGSRSSSAIRVGEIVYRPMATAGSVGVVVTGDFPKAARTKIAQAYANAFRQQVASEGTPEPSAAENLFN